MKINELLEELIAVAKKPKTDFALSMNMTPSGLSKILGGSRVPSMRERKTFTSQAAEYFAEAIYSSHCHIKLTDIFPVIYDFESREELQTFLSSAIAYALDDAFTEEASLNLSHAERGMYYLGRRPVINQLCILLSDLMASCPDEPLEVFAALPLSDPAYSKLLRKLVLSDCGKESSTALHYFFGDGLLDAENGMGAEDLLLFISRIQRRFDLTFHRLGRDIGPFLLFKGKILLLFNTQIDGTPLLVPIYHKSFLNIFYGNLIKKGGEEISLDTAGAAAYLEKNPRFIPRLLDRGIDSVYNFMSIGYLLKKEELAAAGGGPAVCAAMSELFGHILSAKTDFVVSVAAMDRFSSLGKAIVPLIGAVPFPPQLRADYLQRFNAYLSDSRCGMVKIVDSGLANLAVLCSGELCLVYTLDDTFSRERIHVFRSARLAGLLHSELGGAVITDFSMDLWNAYQEGLADIHPGPGAAT